MLSESRKTYNSCEKRALQCIKEASLHRAGEHRFSPLQHLANYHLLLNAVKTNGLGLARKGTKCTAFTYLRQWKKAHSLTIDLLVKDAECWTKTACLKCEVSVRKRQRAEVKGIAETNFVQVFLHRSPGFRETCTPQVCIFTHLPKPRILSAYTGMACLYNLLSPLKYSLSPTGRSYFSTCF